MEISKATIEIKVFEGKISIGVRKDLRNVRGLIKENKAELIAVVMVMKAHVDELALKTDKELLQKQLKLMKEVS